MQMAEHVVALMTGLTKQQIADMRPAERQLLADQCARLQRLVMTEAIVEDVVEIASGVLSELLDRRARPTRGAGSDPSDDPTAH